MACMGPSMSEAAVKKAQEEILALLADKYDVLRHPIIPGQPFGKHYQEQREKVLEQFRHAIRDMFWQEACESF